MSPSPLRLIHSRPIHVLLVEDHADFREVLTAVFELDGFSVVNASNGEDAIRWAQERRPDVIVLDYFLPGIDGAECLSRLRTIESCRNVPVIFATACPYAGLLPQVKPDPHVVAVHTKPIDAPALIATVRKAIHERAE